MKFKIKLISIAVIIVLSSITIAPSISGGPFSNKNIQDTSDSNSIGFIIDVDENQSYDLQDTISILINKLLKENATIYWMSSDISILSKDIILENNITTRSFKKGCFIVPFVNESEKNAKLTTILINANISSNIPLFQLMEAADIEVYTLSEPRIGYVSRFTMEAHNYYQCLLKGGFLNHNFYTVEEINNGKLHEECNIVIHGGQKATVTEICAEMTNPLTIKAYRKIKDFVNNGGGYIGSCHGSLVAASNIKRPISLPIDLQYSSFSKVFFSKILLGLVDRNVYRALPGGSGNFCYFFGQRGPGITVRIVDQDCPVSYGLPEIIENNEYMSGPMFLEKSIGKTSSKDLAVIEDIGNIDEYCWDAMMHACPIHQSKIIPDQIRMNKYYEWINYSIGKALWVTNEYGEGNVVVFGSHPEYYTAVSPPRVVYNAVFYACSTGPNTVDLNNYKTLSFNNITSNGPYEGNLSEEITFKGDFNDDLTSENLWFWNFGDDLIKKGRNVSHIFDDYGQKSIVVCMSKNDELFVNISQVNILGNLNVEVNHYSILKDEMISFNSKVSGGFEPYTYYWDFDDGSFSYEKKPSHSFSSVGVYNCHLLVTDRFENSFICPFSVIVNNVSNNFSGFFNNSVEDRVNIGDTVGFILDISKVDNYRINASFDDGHYYNTSLIGGNVVVFNHSYSRPGMFYPTVVIKDDIGEKVILDAEIFINSPPSTPGKPEGDRQTPVGKQYYIKYYSEDTENDKLWYILNVSTDKYGGKSNTVNLSAVGMIFESGEIVLRNFYCLLDGDYQIRVKAVDEYGAESCNWSDPLNVTVYKASTLWKTPLTAAWRLVLEKPGKYNLLEKSLNLISPSHRVSFYNILFGNLDV